MKKSIILCLGIMAFALNANAANTAKKAVPKAAPAAPTAAPAPAPHNRADMVGSELRGDGKYGTAGCGLGSLLLGKSTGIVQIFATTTNGTFGNQTFGITSGTLNCDAGERKMNASMFVLSNKEALAKDISRGNGEALDNFSKIAGCKDNNLLGSKLQQNYDGIFSKPVQAPEDITNSIFNVIENDNQLKKSCKV